ncbi:hypothetical protein RRG08_052735 [Elysia crispata]|uniref:Uncharacterized protein n=1 Tax=Elysia crispata TaxID=231223 RepID=A0AAE1B5P6_9GAST|nr:hypothetical protein RRG08_052735 [Elysia crispata]
MKADAILIGYLIRKTDVNRGSLSEDISCETYIYYGILASSATLVAKCRFCEHSYFVLNLKFARTAALVGLLFQRFQTTTGSLACATCTRVLHFIVTYEKTRRPLRHPKKSGDSSLQALRDYTNFAPKNRMPQLKLDLGPSHILSRRLAFQSLGRSE